MTDNEHIRRLSPDGMAHNPASSQVAVIPPGATTVLVGGQNGVDADGALVGSGDIGEQTRQAFLNVRTALEAAVAAVLR